MKSNVTRIALVVAALAVLMACQKAPVTTEPTTEDGEVLTSAAELLVGTLRLEGTEHEIDAATAAELLPLWKAYRALLLSDTTVEAELTALEKQIRETMQPAQVQAIEAMGLTTADMAAALQERAGLRQGAGEDLTEEERQALRAAVNGEAGGFRGGAPPAGAMAMGPGGARMLAEGMDPAAIATLRAQGGAGIARQTNRMLAPLIQVVIAVLEGKE